MILEKFAFSFAFNLRKQYVTDFSFISLTQNFVLCLQITTARRCKFLYIVSMVTYKAMDTRQYTLPLPYLLPDI